jgi:uncharacterized protein
MYTEELSVGPTIDDGERGYRRPVADLVRDSARTSRFSTGDVIFKAELAVVTRHMARVRQPSGHS